MSTPDEIYEAISAVRSEQAPPLAPRTASIAERHASLNEYYAFVADRLFRLAELRTQLWSAVSADLSIPRWAVNAAQQAAIAAKQEADDARAAAGCANAWPTNQEDIESDEDYLSEVKNELKKSAVDVCVNDILVANQPVIDRTDPVQVEAFRKAPWVYLMRLVAMLCEAQISDPTWDHLVRLREKIESSAIRLREFDRHDLADELTRKVLTWFGDPYEVNAKTAHEAMGKAIENIDAIASSAMPEPTR